MGALCSLTCAMGPRPGSAPDPCRQGQSHSCCSQGPRSQQLTFTRRKPAHQPVRKIHNKQTLHRVLPYRHHGQETGGSRARPTVSCGTGPSVLPYNLLQPPRNPNTRPYSTSRPNEAVHRAPDSSPAYDVHACMMYGLTPGPGGPCRTWLTGQTAAAAGGIKEKR